MLSQKLEINWWEAGHPDEDDCALMFDLSGSIAGLMDYACFYLHTKVFTVTSGQYRGYQEVGLAGIQGF